MLQDSELAVRLTIYLWLGCRRECAPAEHAAVHRRRQRHGDGPVARAAAAAPGRHGCLADRAPAPVGPGGCPNRAGVGVSTRMHAAGVVRLSPGPLLPRLGAMAASQTALLHPLAQVAAMKRADW